MLCARCVQLHGTFGVNARKEEYWCTLNLSLPADRYMRQVQGKKCGLEQAFSELESKRRSTGAAALRLSMEVQASARKRLISFETARLPLIRKLTRTLPRVRVGWLLLFSDTTVEMVAVFALYGVLVPVGDDD